MNRIDTVGNSSPIQKILSQPIHREVSVDAPAPAAVTDRLELSGVSHLLKALKTNDIRADKVAAIKAQIEAGTYETDHKLNVAADRLLDDLSR